MHVEFLDDESVIHTAELVAGALNVGRSSSNDVILRHPGISGHHAMIFLEAGVLRVRDLGSTNGTFLDGERLYGEAAIYETSEVRFGSRITLRVRSPEEAVGAYVLGHSDGDVATPVDRDPFPIPGTAHHLHTVGALRVTGPEGGAEVEVNVPFEVDGVRWVVTLGGETQETARSEAAAPPYSLVVDLHAPMAVLTHHETSVQIRSAAAVAALHVLGQAWLANPADGWLDDEDVGLGAWGRAWRDQGPNNLNVMLHRIRKKVEGAGLDRWFLERRPGETRLRVASVRLD